MGQPDFMIIGVMKSGTGTLFHELCQHPHIKRGDYKEVHYFSKYYDKGYLREWYEGRFPNDCITGEATPAYMLLNKSRIQEIKNWYPECKFIAIFRHPIDRAISQYHHVSKKNERRGIGYFVKDPKTITERALYWEQIKKWADIVGWDRIKLIKSEDYWQNNNIQACFKYLGLKPCKIDRLRKGDAKYQKPNFEKMRTIYGLFPDGFYKHIQKDIEAFMENTGIVWENLNEYL